MLQKHFKKTQIDGAHLAHGEQLKRKDPERVLASLKQPCQNYWLLACRVRRWIPPQ